MNQTEQVLLQAIQKSLWNRDIGFPEDADWNAVLKEAEKQAILGIVAPAAPEQIQIEWESKVGHVPVNFIRILHYQDGLCRLLREADIPFVILKGTAAAMYYPDPTQRTMGDIDYLVPEAHFDRAAALLTENGYSGDRGERKWRSTSQGLRKSSVLYYDSHIDGVVRERSAVFTADGHGAERGRGAYDCGARKQDLRCAFAGRTLLHGSGDFFHRGAGIFHAEAEGGERDRPHETAQHAAGQCKG